MNNLLAKIFGHHEEPQAVPQSPDPKSRVYALPEELEKSVEGKSEGEKSTAYSQFRTGLSMHRTDLSEHRTDMSVHRTTLSDARSHMANERTHLAQIRTAVSLMSFGITLNRFSIYLMENDRTPEGYGVSLVGTESIGAGMVVLGIGLLVFSLLFYRRTRHQIDTNTFRPAGASLTILTLLIIGLGVISTGFLIMPWLEKMF